MAKKAKKHFLSADTYISMALGLAVVLLVGAAIYNFFGNRSFNTSSQTETDSQRENVPLIHKVKDNETLWDIANKYYNNGYNWVEIQKSNNLTDPDNLKVGQVLIIPAVIETSGDIDPVAASTDSKPLHESVTVEKGESLWSIASREYGNPYRWTDIAQTNDLANPDIIHSGNILRLP